MSKRQCAHCKTRKPAEQMLIRGLKAYCSQDHFIEWAAGNVSSLAKQGRKKERQRFAEKKKAIKAENLSHQRKLTQDTFNRMRVLQELEWFSIRGMEPTCISCGLPLGGDQWCCGHFKTRGSHPELALDPKNTYLQHNVRCNKNLSGDIAGTKNTHGYIAGILNRFGQVEGQAIIDYCESHHPAKKYTGAQYKAMRAEFAKEIRRLEQKLAA